MKCDIIMVTWNEPELTRKALTSIRDHSNYPYRLILIDNGSDPETIATLDEANQTQQYGETLLIKNTINKGWLKATNQGIAVASGQYVCLINNDIVAGHSWLKNMIATLERNPEVGIANPRGNERSENLKIKNVDLYARKLEEVNHEGFTELDHASGFCMLIKRQVIDKLGNLDEIYEFGHYEDHDYSKHAQREGYRVIQCDDAFVLHYGSVSFKKVPELRKQMIERNRGIYEQRWGRQLRFLVLMKTSDPECLLEIARKGYLVYVIGNDNIAPDKFVHPHQNIRFLNSWVCKISETLYFLFKAYYLRRKKRVDHALILFNRNICEIFEAH